MTGAKTAGAAALTARWAPLAGRLLISMLFLWSGWRKLGMPGPVIANLAHAGFPVPVVGYGLSLAAELGLGTLLVLGLMTRWSAAGLAVFTLTTALMFHTRFADPPQMINFMKNVALIGGFLQIVAFGGGELSVDGWLAARRPRPSA